MKKIAKKKAAFGKLSANFHETHKSDIGWLSLGEPFLISENL